MQVLDNTSDLAQLPPKCVLSVGNFDGLHTGHREIIKTARRIAEKNNTKVVAMTFDPHPVAILYPEKTPGVLTDLGYKKALLEKAGVDYLVVLTDSKELLKTPPADFVEKFLVAKINPTAVVEGPDFNFGNDRAGSIQTLKKLGSKNGFDVVIVPDKEVRLSTGQIVRASSTVIRYMLESGHPADASAALGRPYRLIGKIIPGRGQGRKLGFPTLNMQKPTQVIPAEGVYAGRVQLADNGEELYHCTAELPAVFSIGQARTFGQENPLLIEAHILDTDIPLAPKKWMAMDFIEHIRKQRKFPSEEHLSKQIQKDCQTAQKMLTATS